MDGPDRNKNATRNGELFSPTKTVAEHEGDDLITIPEFFAHKNIFVTGVTGFLGTVLLEALLDTHENIGKIYVLVRGKRNQDPKDRMTRLLKKPIFQKHSEKTLAKVIPVVGELSELNFNFTDEVYNELIENVNVIFHCAATIKFSSPLRTAIKTNVTGTLRTIELAKKVKNLTSYVYCSTAFCNSINRGLIMERVYTSKYDPYEMLKIAEDDSYWEQFTNEKCKEIIGDHPNTYTFTKNISENLLKAEMTGYPAAIVRPSIVYGTWENPVRGWVGNASSGHLGFLAGFVKGIFRTTCGTAASVIDIIPCDYVINSSLVMAWYAGTRKLAEPEIIHCTSGEVNPLTLGQFCQIMNESVERHPPNNFVWKPNSKLRNGWRNDLFFYIFHYIPAIIFLIPEKLFGIGMPQHTVLEFMHVFRKGTKAFSYFLDRNFCYSMRNSLRINSIILKSDKKRYNFDSSQCDWSEFLDRCLIGIRRYYFKESAVTTQWHRNYWRIFNVLYYLGFVVLFGIVFGITAPIFGMQIGLGLSIIIWGFLVWL